MEKKSLAEVEVRLLTDPEVLGPFVGIGEKNIPVEIIWGILPGTTGENEYPFVKVYCIIRRGRGR